MSSGNVNVEPLSHKTFLFAYRIIEQLYGGGADVLKEITMADEGIVLYDGVVPVGVCLIRYGVVELDYPLVMDCCVLDEYKGTKWAIRLLRELKRLVRADAYYIIYGGEEYLYKGFKNSIEAIVKTKSIGTKNGYTLIRNR
jgi:hypothetical protein